MNVDKSKMMIFERRESEVLDFAVLYKTDKSSELKCKGRIGGEQLEEVRKCK